MSNDFKMKTGEVSWGSGDDKKGGLGGKDQYLRLQAGSNVVRILTLPNQYYQHKYMPEGGKKWGYRVNCSAANGSCVLCDKGDKAKRRWLVGVIDRKTGQYKLLDLSWSIFKGVQTLNNSEDWSNPINYNIDIVMNPNGGATGFYTVVPKPKSPLSAADLVIQADNDPSRVTERTTPPTSEQTLKRIEKIHEEIVAQGGNANPDFSAQGSSDTGDDDFFPDHKSNEKTSF